MYFFLIYKRHQWNAGDINHIDSNAGEGGIDYDKNGTFSTSAIQYKLVNRVITLQCTIYVRKKTPGNWKAFKETFQKYKKDLLTKCGMFYPITI